MQGIGGTLKADVGETLEADDEAGARWRLMTGGHRRLMPEACWGHQYQRPMMGV